MPLDLWRNLSTVPWNSTKGERHKCLMCLVAKQTIVVPTELISHPIHYVNEL